MNSKYTKEHPFIQDLIQKRLCYHDTYSHIAAFTTKEYPSAIGQNSDRSPYSNNKIKMHAEIDALQKINNMIRNKKIKRRNKLNLIVLRVNKSGNLCESAPCYHCSQELMNQKFCIDTLHFSTADGSIKSIKFTHWISSADFHTSKGWKWMNKER
jgi:hypothetical protein